MHLGMSGRFEIARPEGVKRPGQFRYAPDPDPKHAHVVFETEAGARIILVPSATDSMQGYWRVRIGGQARALENQCYVVQAPTVGLAPWLPSLDENYGAAGVYGPPDGITPDDGIFAIGHANDGQWLFADVDLTQVDEWRRNGSVLPFRHWPEQMVGQASMPAGIANDNAVEPVERQNGSTLPLVEGLSE